MAFIRVLFLISLINVFVRIPLAGQEIKAKPVNPKASPEAVALLDLFYSISGKYILSGQHNYPNIKDRNTLFASKYIGKTPVVFSTDWGFAKEDDKDSYLARPQIVKEAIRRFRLGSIITICWHAVPPTAKEPVTFQPVPGTTPAALASVQGQLTDQQFRDILTPGTSLYKSWCAQVDSVAHYLKLLQDAHVPVLWRPYHEMNGSWFWWGGRTGKYSTQALYRQLFNRLTKIHGLNNLIWIWSVDRPTRPEMKFSDFYPGNNYLDILALDVYGSDFNQAYYDSLVALSNGKPVVLAEVGNPPTPEILSKQPKWAYFSTWAGMVRNTTKKEYRILTGDPRVLFLEDRTFREVSEPYRKICGLPLPEEAKRVPADFSGDWLFDEDRSTLGNAGTGNVSDRIRIIQTERDLTLARTYIQEDSDDRIATDVYSFEKQLQTETGNFTRVTSAKRSENMDTVFLNTTMTVKRGARTTQSAITEIWYLSDNMRTLFIDQVSATFMGKSSVRLVYDKE